MIGCEFCRMEENGDFGFDLKPLAVINAGWKPETKEVYDPEIHAWMPLPKHYQPQKMFSQEPDLMEHSILRDDDPEMYTGKYVYEQMSIEEFLGEVDR